MSHELILTCLVLSVHKLEQYFMGMDGYGTLYLFIKEQQLIQAYYSHCSCSLYNRIKHHLEISSYRE